MTEHRCGPTAQQVQDATMRGETLGTWERCPACAEKERLLWTRIGPHAMLAPETPTDWPKPIITGI